MPHFPRCERTQHKIIMAESGSRTKPLARHWRLWQVYSSIPHVGGFCDLADLFDD